MMQALEKILKGRDALLRAGDVVLRRIDDVAGVELLPEWEAAGGACIAFRQRGGGLSSFRSRGERTRGEEVERVV